MPNLIYASGAMRRLACSSPASLNTLFKRVLAVLQYVTGRQQRAVKDATMCDHRYLLKVDAELRTQEGKVGGAAVN
jgi:hypothetical protein